MQRTPRAGTTGWEMLLSEQLSDWYNPEDSAAFTKKLLNISVPLGGVVIEASEFGDVLLTSGVRVASGIESPLENSTTYNRYNYIIAQVSPSHSPISRCPDFLNFFPWHLHLRA